jgi:CheY-like chemotaxis protein
MELNVTILLLVADQLVRAVMREVLERAGYVVVATGDLGVAVDRLKELNPDLLITRTYVNTMPGHDAAKYLRTKKPALPVLIVGGMLRDERLEYRESLENFEVFPPPYSSGEFLAKVQEVLNAAPSRKRG